MKINNNNTIKYNSSPSFSSKIDVGTAMRAVQNYAKETGQSEILSKALNTIKTYPEPLYFKISSYYHHTHGMCTTKFKYNDGKNVYTAVSDKCKSAPEATLKHILELADSRSEVYSGIYRNKISRLVVEQKR